jgi:UDP-N-acetyl-2-amino-2-deoxyglucuronate dehydrogenase
LTEIGIGIIGLGIGMSRARMAQQADGIHVAAVCSLAETERDTASRELGVTAYEDYRSLLDRKDVDVVGIFTPAGLRRDIALDAIKAGKHVLLSKPMEINIQRCDEMISAADEEAVRLFTELDTRYRPANRAIKHAISEGRFGRMYMGDARLKWHRSQEYYDSGSGWRGTWRLDGGGSLANQTVHFVDRLQWFMGPISSVFGYAGVHGHEIEAEDQTVAVVKYESGAFGTIASATTAVPEFAFTRTELHGERGGVVTMTVDGTYMPKDRTRTVPYVQQWVVTDDAGEAIESEPVEPVGGPTNIMEDIVGVLRDGKEPYADGREGRKSVEIVNAIYESAQTGREIHLPLEKPFIPKEGYQR